MFRLDLGRVVRIVIDGIPSMLLIVYAVLEIAIGPWGILILKKPIHTQLEP